MSMGEEMPVSASFRSNPSFNHRILVIFYCYHHVDIRKKRLAISAKRRAAHSADPGSYSGSDSDNTLISHSSPPSHSTSTPPFQVKQGSASQSD